jgi:hypothetical protein
VIETLHHWLHGYRGLGWPVAVGLAVAMALLSMFAGFLMVVVLPADYFVRSADPRGFWQSHALLRLVFLVAKNCFGIVAFIVGFVMALPLIPGPGVLFMLIGLAAVDFPGKRALEARLLGLPRILASANRLRARFGKPPIEIHTHR